MNLPIEIVNKILLFREQHPLAKILDLYIKSYNRIHIGDYGRFINNIQKPWSEYYDHWSFFRHIKYYLRITKMWCNHCHTIVEEDNRIGISGEPTFFKYICKCDQNENKWIREEDI